MSRSPERITRLQAMAIKNACERQWKAPIGCKNALGKVQWRLGHYGHLQWKTPRQREWKDGGMT